MHVPFVVIVVAIIVLPGVGYACRSWFHKQVGSAGKLAQEAEQKVKSKF